jgi:hypothetical protein
MPFKKGDPRPPNSGIKKGEKQNRITSAQAKTILRAAFAEDTQYWISEFNRLLKLPDGQGLKCVERMDYLWKLISTYGRFNAEDFQNEGSNENIYTNVEIDMTLEENEQLQEKVEIYKKRIGELEKLLKAKQNRDCDR